MNNSAFLTALEGSFAEYLESGARSNEKLKVLHGAVAKDIASRLAAQKGGENLSVFSLDTGEGKEKGIDGRYTQKKADIAICRDGRPIAGVAVKFVMSNYKQNSNNYFENMLGETANIRCADILYFQLLAMLDKLPYFNRDGRITKWERITESNLKKYLALSRDNPGLYRHTPDKTLVFVVRICEGENPTLTSKSEYIKHYLGTSFTFGLSELQFCGGQALIYNDYESFADKVTYAVLSV